MNQFELPNKNRIISEFSPENNTKLFKKFTQSDNHAQNIQKIQSIIFFMLDPEFRSFDRINISLMKHIINSSYLIYKDELSINKIKEYLKNEIEDQPAHIFDSISIRRNEIIFVIKNYLKKGIQKEHFDVLSKYSNTLYKKQDIYKFIFALYEFERL